MAIFDPAIFDPDIFDAGEGEEPELEPIDATDTLSVALSEEAVVAEFGEITDSLVLALGETEQTDEVASAADTLSIEVEDVADSEEEGGGPTTYFGRRYFGARYFGSTYFGAAEVAEPELEELDVSDSLAIALDTEAATADVLEVSETLELGVSEAVALLEAEAAAETLAVAVSDAATAEDTADLTETLDVAVSEAASILEVLADVTDSLELAVDETPTTADVLSTEDTLELAVAEVATNSELASVVDSLSIVVSDAATADDSIEVADTLDAAVGEAADLTEILTDVEDVLGVAISEAIELTDRYDVEDQLDVASSEIADLLEEDQSEVIGVVDSLVLESAVETLDTYDVVSAAEEIVLRLLLPGVTPEELAGKTDSLLIRAIEESEHVTQIGVSDTLDIAATDVRSTLDLVGVDDWPYVGVAESAPVVMVGLLLADALKLQLAGGLTEDLISTTDLLGMVIQDAGVGPDVFDAVDALVLNAAETSVAENGREADLLSDVERLITTGYSFGHKRMRPSRHVGPGRSHPVQPY